MPVITAYEAVVIGAGPAGASAAILLARAGWSIALVEKQHFPRRKVCGECIAAPNLPLLDALGVGDAFAALAGPPLQRVELWCGTEALSAALPAARDAKHPWGRALAREYLDTLLLERARSAGATVLQPFAARSVEGEPGDLRCDIVSLDDGRAATLRAPLVIDAHGSWQPLRSERSEWRAARRGGDLLAFKVNLRDVSLSPGVLPVLAFAGGYGGIVVADRGLATLACCVRAERLAACRRASPGAPAGAVIEAYLKRECASLRAALAAASPVAPWLAAGPLKPGVRLPRGGAEGRTFLIGNAAGEAHPIVGEGISMALQSAWLLCEQLVHDRDVLRRGEAGRARQRQIQQRYVARWRACFGPRLRIARGFAAAAMRPGAAAMVVPLLRRAPSLLGLGARWSGKTRCAVDLEALGTINSTRLADAAWSADRPAGV